MMVCGRQDKEDSVVWSSGIAELDGSGKDNSPISKVAILDVKRGQTYLFKKKKKKDLCQGNCKTKTQLTTPHD